jgi:Tfp pilus assembly protein PilN
LEDGRKMNIDINILPEELRPKPLIDTKTVVLIVVILLLGFGCYHFAQAKSNSQAEITKVQGEISTTQQQIVAVSNNSEAKTLINSINQLKAAKQSYDAFVASRVLVGNALDGVYSLAPVWINIDSVTQSGSTLTIKGSASSYADLSGYVSALKSDPKFSVVGLPTYSSNKSFSLTVSVVPGGSQ